MPSWKILLVLVLVLGLPALPGCGKHQDPMGAARIHLERGRFKQAAEVLRNAPPEVRKTYAANMLLAQAYLGAGEHEASLRTFEAAAKLKPDEVAPLLGMAEVAVHQAAHALRSGDITRAASLRKQAETRCRTALAIDPKSSKNADVYAQLGRILAMSKERVGEATQAYEEAIRRAPNDAELRLKLAELYRATGKPDRAMELADEALLRKPNFAVARLLRGQLLAIKDKEQAKKELGLALASSKLGATRRADAIRLLAYLCWETGDSEAARQRVRQLKKLGKYLSDAQYLSGVIAYQEGRYEDAEKDLKPLERFGHVPALMRLGATLEKLHKVNQAIAVYERIASKLDPKYVPARLSLARLDLGRRLYEDAMRHCQAALKEQPANPYALRYLARVYRDRASPHHDYDMALVCYRKLMAHNPESPTINLDIAELYLDQRRPLQAEQRALLAGSQEDNARFRLVLGRAYLLMHLLGMRDAPEKSNLEKALDNLKLAHSKDPLRLTMALQLARAHTFEGKPDDAIAVLRPFISQRPRAGEAYLRLATIFEGPKRDLPSAIETLERAVRVPGIEMQSTLKSALGRAYFLNGEMQKAIETWQKLTVESKETSDISVSVGLAVAQALDKQYDKALSQAEKIVHATRQRSTAGPMVAACIAIQAGDFDRAKRFLTMRAYPSSREEAARIDFLERCRKAGDQGKQAAALISQGILHMEFGRPEAAVDDLKKATKLVPGSILPHYILANARYRARRFPAVLATYKDIFKKFPAQGFPHLRLAMLSRELDAGQVNVEQQIELALDLDPELTAAHVTMAQIKLAQAREAPHIDLFNAAVKHSQEAVKLDGGTLSSLAALSQALTSLADFRRSELMEEKNPETVRVKMARAIAAQEAAKKALHALGDRFPLSVKVAKARIRFHLAQRDFGAAAGLATQFLQKTEWQDDQELRLLAATAFAERGDQDKARGVLLEVLRVNPASVRAYRQLATVEIRRKNPAAAIGALERALKLNPGDLSVRFDLAGALLRFGRPDAAARTYKSIVDTIEPNDRRQRALALRTAARLGRAHALMAAAGPTLPDDERRNRLDNALKTLKGLTDPPEGGVPNPAAVVLECRVLQEMGQSAAALSACEKCLKAQPAYGPALYTKVFLLHEAGQHDAAIKLILDELLPTHRYDLRAYEQLAFEYLARGGPRDKARAAKTTDELMDLLARRKRARLVPSPELEARYRIVRILAVTAAQRYARAKTVAQGFEKIDKPMLDSLFRLIDRCSRDPAGGDQLIRHYSAALFYQSAGDRPRQTRAMQAAARALPKNLFLLNELQEIHLQAGQLAALSAVREEMVAAAALPDRAVPVPYHQDLRVQLIQSYDTRMRVKEEDAADKAIDACKRALSRWPDHTGILKRLADIQTAAGRVAPAIAVLESILAKSAEGSAPWVDARRRLAHAYYGLGQLDKVMEQCRAVDSYLTNKSNWLNNSAWFHAMANDLKTAASRAERAKELDPNNPHIRDTLGWIYSLGGHHRKAVPELEYAARELPRNASVTYHLGANELALNKLREGLAHLRRAMDIHRSPGPSAKLNAVEEQACHDLIEQTEKELERGT